MNRFMPILIVYILCISPVFGDSSEDVASKFCAKSNKWYARALEALENKGYIRNQDATEKFLHRGCREVKWMTQTRKSICEGSSDLSKVQLPEKFLFIFDGFAGFNPELGAKYKAVNLSGLETNDFGKGYGNGIKAFMAAFEKANELEKTTELHYHATSGFQSRENVNSAIACAIEIKEYVDAIQTLSPRTELPQWVVLGFSNGGDRATLFQNKLAEKKNLAIDLVLTVDPVAQWGSFFFDLHKNTIGKRHPLTKRFVNFYQSIDRNSFALLGLKGKPVRKADHNIHVQPTQLPSLANEKYPHSALMASNFLSEMMVCELKKLDAPELECDYSQFP